MSAASQPGKVAPKFRRRKKILGISPDQDLWKWNQMLLHRNFVSAKFHRMIFWGLTRGVSSISPRLIWFWAWCGSEGGILWNTLEARWVKSQRARLSGPLSFYSHLVPCIILGFLLQILASYPFVGRGVVHCLKFKWWLIKIVQWIRPFLCGVKTNKKQRWKWILFFR